jgi:hypothetical protein
MNEQHGKQRLNLVAVVASLLIASTIQAQDAELFLMSYPNASITIDGAPSDWNLGQFGKIVTGGAAAGGDESAWERQTGTGDIAVLGWDEAGTTVHYGSKWTGNVLPENRADNAVKFYARHNETHQYFLVDIIDDEINTDDEAAWANDSVEFYFDPTNDRGGSAGGDPPWESDVQLVIDAANNVQVWNSPVDYETKIEAGVQSAITTTATGWLLEVGIDKSVFDEPLPSVLGPANDPSGNNFGIDLSYRDNDDPDDTGTRNGDPVFSSNYVWADPNSVGGFPTKLPDNWGQMIVGVAADPAARLDDGTLTDPAQRAAYVRDVLRTWLGDSNLDGEFNSADFVLVFTAGEYEDTTPDNSTWKTGNWNGDRDFDSSDFVTAFTDGGYERGPRAATPALVPEPVSGVPLVSALLLLLPLRRLRR